MIPLLIGGIPLLEDDSIGLELDFVNVLETETFEFIDTTLTAIERGCGLQSLSRCGHSGYSLQSTALLHY